MARSKKKHRVMNLSESDLPASEQLLTTIRKPAGNGAWQKAAEPALIPQTSKHEVEQNPDRHVSDDHIVAFDDNAEHRRLYLSDAGTIGTCSLLN